MTNKSSINIQPCNVRQSEAHNWRKKEYMQNIKKEHITIRTEFSMMNRHWVASEFRYTGLPKYLEMLAALVKEKTGRAMQMKVRERVNKKTGRVSKVNGCSALKEGVIICKEDTTMRDLLRFCQRCQNRWGITAIQVHIHRDEGSWTNDESKQWKPNLHAHIVWDWIDHSTGKTYKLNQKDMSEMQDIAAETLGMERGTRKEETGLEHLSRNDYILAKQKKELEELQKKLAEQKKEAEKANEKREVAISSAKAMESQKNIAEQKMNEALAARNEANSQTTILLEKNKQLAKDISAKNGQLSRMDDELLTKQQEIGALTKNAGKIRQVIAPFKNYTIDFIAPQIKEEPPMMNRKEWLARQNKMIEVACTNAINTIMGLYYKEAQKQVAAAQQNQLVDYNLYQELVKTNKEQTMKIRELMEKGDNFNEILSTILDIFATPNLREACLAMTDALIGGYPVPTAAGGGGGEPSDFRWDGRKDDEDEYAYHRRCLMHAILATTTSRRQRPSQTIQRSRGL